MELSIFEMNQGFFAWRYSESIWDNLFGTVFNVSNEDEIRMKLILNICGVV